MTVPNALQKQILAWSEAKLQEEIRSAAVEHGWLEYHTYDSRRSTPGFPDLVLVHPLRRALVFRELKRQGKNPTDKQLHWLQSLAAAGQDVGVWRPEDWVSGKIQRLLVQGPPRASPPRGDRVRLLGMRAAVAPSESEEGHARDD